jgi:hypothetical protein
MMKAQPVNFAKGDPARGELLCQNKSKDPLDNSCKLLAPFAVAVDQQDPIWVTSGFDAHVTRFPASDPTKAETFKTGFLGGGQGVVVFYGMAKPVRTPLIGPPRAP